MMRYIASRTAIALLSLMAISLAVFGLLHLDAATPAAAILGIRHDTPANIAALNRAMGLNLPVPVQYAHWLSTFTRPHGAGTRILLGNLPVTLELLGLGMGFSLLLGAWVALYQVQRPGSRGEKALTAATYIMSAVPGFWLAIILVWIFTLNFLWLPPPGPPLPDQMGFWWWARFETLPVATIALTTVGYWSRQFRSALEEALRSEYVRTARAKGLPERRILYRHVLRNAVLPLIALAGLSLPNALNTVIAVEVIFYLPGAGRLLINSVNGLFFTTATSVAMVLALVTVGANWLADISYSLIDPRIEYH
jgi:peptide/nickel transport system permease protein